MRKRVRGHKNPRITKRVIRLKKLTTMILFTLPIVVDEFDLSTDNATSHNISVRGGHAWDVFSSRVYISPSRSRTMSVSGLRTFLAVRLENEKGRKHCLPTW